MRASLLAAAFWQELHSSRRRLPARPPAKRPVVNTDFLRVRPPQKVEQFMVDEIRNLRKTVKVGIVGGSDLSKQVEQLGPEGEQRRLLALLHSLLASMPQHTQNIIDYGSAAVFNLHLYLYSNTPPVAFSYPPQ
jgi:hypothetical protein